MSKDIKGKVDGVALWAGSSFAQVVVNIPVENVEDFAAGEHVILNVREG